MDKMDGCCNFRRSGLVAFIIIGFLLVASVVVAVVFIILEEKPRSSAGKEEVVDDKGHGEALFLTPLIEAGLLKQAKQRSRVTELDGFDDEIYAGFITINKTHNSNLYFVFYPARVNPANATVILWMNGGPGNPSIFCMTECSGPFLVDKELHMTANSVSWTDKYSIIYLDQPVETGFSFTDNSITIPDNEEDIADGVYSFLHQFFSIFPYHRNDVYIVGQSYAGKYAPAVAHKIHNQNSSANLKINLKGLAIAGAFSDPESMILKIGDYAFYNGLITEKERDYINMRMNETVQFIREDNFIAATKVFDEMILGTGKFHPSQPSYFQNKTDGILIHNIQDPTPDESVKKFSNFVNKTSIRRAFHTGNRTFSNGDSVYIKMMIDMLKTAKPWYEELLANNYSMLFYNGQFDGLTSVAMEEAFIWALNWTDSEVYKTADKLLWKSNPDDKIPAGFVRKGGNLYQATILGGGHFINGDQRERSFHLVDRFIEGRLL